MAIAREESGAEAVAPFGVEFHAREIGQDKEDVSEPLDPYSWMSDRDRWMIGKPADRECYAYLDRMDKTRRQNAEISLYLSSYLLPFPANLIYLLVLFLKVLRK